MTDKLKKCEACSGRGYFSCGCWPADCICSEGDENCFECGGDGFLDPDEDWWPENDTSDPTPATNLEGD